jgi:hypothetical protein
MALCAVAMAAHGQSANLPILFVVQVPTSDDFGNAFATFGSHLA